MGKTIRCSVVVFNCHDYQGVSLTLNHQVLMLSVFKKHQFPIFFLEKIVFFPQNHHCSIFFPGKNHVFSTKPPFLHIFPWKKSWFLFHHHHVMSRPVVPRCRPLAFLTGTQQRAEGCHICLDLHRLGGTNNDWWCTRRQGGAPVG